MSSRLSAYDLSIPELLRVLNEELCLECTRLRETLPSVVSAASLEREVRESPPVYSNNAMARSQSSPQIDDLEARAHDVLKLIPSLRNLLRPVNRLPPEIFSHIVRFVPDEGVRDTKSIVPLTHVCRCWRESIISTPGNWTLVSSYRKGLAVSSLERSKAAPVKLSLDMCDIRGDPEFSFLITSYIQNAETLRINGLSTIEEFTQTLPNFPQLLPNLRLLYLSGCADLGRSVDPFGSSFPTLTQFSLMDIPLYPSFLRLRTLTDLSLFYDKFDLHLDTLLDFLEENPSLERAILDIEFTTPSLRSLQGRVVTANRLRSLAILSSEAMDGSALISSIALQRGAHLTISLYDYRAGQNDLLSVISMAHLPNLRSPTHMTYNPDHRNVRLLGPNGSLSFDAFGLNPFPELPSPHLTNVRSFYFIRRESRSIIYGVVFPPSSFPALETLVVEHEATVSHLFSALFSNPSSSPSLETLAFLDCVLGEDFMEELTRFASNRKNTTSAWLRRVFIVDSKGGLPGAASIDELGKHVPDVDARIGEKLPADLMR